MIFSQCFTSNSHGTITSPSLNVSKCLISTLILVYPVKIIKVKLNQTFITFFDSRTRCNKLSLFVLYLSCTKDYHKHVDTRTCAIRWLLNLADLKGYKYHKLNLARHQTSAYFFSYILPKLYTYLFVVARCKF